MPEVRRAVPEDVAGIVDILARAFVDDPVSSYLFPSRADRERVLRRFFRVQLRQSYLRRGEVWVEAGLRSAALWMPPEPGTSVGDELRLHVALWPVLGGRLGAARRLARLLAARRPRVAHWYLGTLGTDPGSQRHGHATSLLRPVLRRCDRAGMPVYLESSREDNVGFYERRGFEVVGEVTPTGGPTLWLMWRQPGCPVDD